MQNDPLNTQSLSNYKPTTAYIGASWAVLGVGIVAFFAGLWNAPDTALALSEKGYYGAVMALGLYSAISLQKTIRDKSEGIPTSMMYYWISWSALGTAVVLIIIGLMNASALSLSEQGFYMMAFTMSLFAAITIQKNTRDNAQIAVLQSGHTSPKLLNTVHDSTVHNSTLANEDALNHKDASTNDEKSLFGTLRSKT